MVFLINDLVTRILLENENYIILLLALKDTNTKKEADQKNNCLVILEDHTYVD